MSATHARFVCPLSQADKPIMALRRSPLLDTSMAQPITIFLAALRDVLVKLDERSLRLQWPLTHNCLYPQLKRAR
jgi:hypothetical protein